MEHAADPAALLVRLSAAKDQVAGFEFGDKLEDVGPQLRARYLELLFQRVHYLLDVKVLFQ